MTRQTLNTLYIVTDALMSDPAVRYNMHKCEINEHSRFKVNVLAMEIAHNTRFRHLPYLQFSSSPSSCELLSCLPFVSQHTILSAHIVLAVDQAPQQSGAYPFNKHTLLECPIAPTFKSRILSKLPPQERPGGWDEQTNPSRTFGKI